MKNLLKDLVNFRTNEGLSKSLAAKTYGGVWTKLEQGLEVKLNGEQLKKINQVIDMSGLLSLMIITIELLLGEN